MKKYDRPWYNPSTGEYSDPDKTWKEMTPEEKKSHVKQVAMGILNSLLEDKTFWHGNRDCTIIRHAVYCHCKFCDNARNSDKCLTY